MFIGSTEIASIAPSETATPQQVIFNTVVPHGFLDETVTYYITAIVDPEHTYEELDKTNNKTELEKVQAQIAEMTRIEEMNPSITISPDESLTLLSIVKVPSDIASLGSHSLLEANTFNR